MPTYDELAKLLRQLVKAIHTVLGQQELQLTHETSSLMVTLKQAQDALMLLQPPVNAATTVNAAPATSGASEEDGSVIHLYGPAGSGAS